MSPSSAVGSMAYIGSADLRSLHKKSNAMLDRKRLVNAIDSKSEFVVACEIMIAESSGMKRHAGVVLFKVRV